jgi:hypothetical protein
MIQIKKFWYVFLYSFVLFSCSDIKVEKPNKTAIAKNEKSKEWKGELNDFLDKYKLCVVLTNNGCLGCNESIVEIAEKYLKSGEKRLGVVIESIGTTYDISPLLKDEFKNQVCQDFRAQLTNRYKRESSFVLYYPSGMENSQVELFEVTLKNMKELEPKLNGYLSLLQ